jgi:hypothetical protein
MCAIIPPVLAVECRLALGIVVSVSTMDVVCSCLSCALSGSPLPSSHGMDGLVRVVGLAGGERGGRQGGRGRPSADAAAGLARKA